MNRPQTDKTANFFDPRTRDLHRQRQDAERQQRPRRWDRALTPKQAGRFQYLWLSLIGLLLMMVLLGLLGCQAFGSSDWVGSQAYLSPPQIRELVTTSSRFEPDTPEYEALTKGMKTRLLAPNLVAVIFDSPLLTGANGIRFAVVQVGEGTQRVTPVLQTYLDPYLPEGIPLIKVLDRTQHDLPCLQIFQTAHASEAIERFEFCFNRQKYELQDEKTLPVTEGD